MARCRRRRSRSTCPATRRPTPPRVPAGILQAPLFSPHRTVAVHLGGIGVAVATSPRTASTARRRARRRRQARRRWSADDRSRFSDPAACVAEPYATFEAAPGASIQGALTLGENIADLGGMKLVVRPRARGQDQRRLAFDRAPVKRRVYGALRNLPALADAFRGAPGTPMHPRIHAPRGDAPGGL
ncbi:MAG TPA: M13-type metalloendopeptidase [Kofleriaceae bacterium]|nr:M13-type metalloendopeptidase [Kofleriaceae bacterium]